MHEGLAFCTVAHAPLQMAHVWLCVAVRRSEPHVLSAAQLSALIQECSCVLLTESEFCSSNPRLSAKTEASKPKLSDG